MEETGPNELPDDQLMREAASWFARMRSPDADASRDAFEAWLRRGALHLNAYNRAAEIFAMGKLLAEPAPPPAARRRSRILVLPLVAALALAGAGWLAIRATDWGGDPDRIAAVTGDARLIVTAPGERRSVRLADGSRVDLGEDSRLDVAIDGAARHLALLRGRARFAVFHDARPFIVRAGGGQVVARGTLFEVVLTHDARVSVRLIEGMVDISGPVSRAGAPAPVRRLRAGESLSFRQAAGPAADTGARAPDPPGGDTASAMPARDHDAVTLAALVEAANREGTPHIRLADPALGARRVSGRFRTADTRLLAERLAILFDLEIVRDPAGAIVLRPR